MICRSAIAARLSLLNDGEKYENRYLTNTCVNTANGTAGGLQVENRRRSPRYGVDVDGIIRSGGGAEHAVAIANLSVDGCRFTASGRRMAAGTLLAIGIGPVGLLHARVAWRVGAVHGVSFDQPLHPAVLDHIRLFLSQEPAFIEERPAA